MKPLSLTIEVSVSTGIICLSSDLPKRSAIRPLSDERRREWRVVSLLMRVKSTPMLTRASLSNSRIILLSSTESFFRNLRRAGTLKKRFLTIILLPGAHASGVWLSTFDPLITRRVPIVSSLRMVRRSTWAIAAIEASASPRNPIVDSVKRSSARLIFEVAWRSKAMRASVSLIPQPLSITWISVRPASLSIMVMEVAPASMEFSTSSFITDAGRWITSPAAIWLATESGRSLITSLIALFLLYYRGFCMFVVGFIFRVVVRNSRCVCFRACICALDFIGNYLVVYEGIKRQ